MEPPPKLNLSSIHGIGPHDTLTARNCTSSQYDQIIKHESLAAMAASDPDEGVLSYSKITSPKFDRHTAQHLKDFLKSRKLSYPDRSFYDERVKSFCLDELEAEFADLGEEIRQIPVGEFFMKHHQKSQRLLKNMQEKGVLLEPIVTKISLIRQELLRYLEEKEKQSDWSVKLLAVLKDLSEMNVGIDTKIPDLSAFIAIFERDADNSMKEVIMSTFGSDASMQQQVWECLKEWSDQRSVSKIIHLVSESAENAVRVANISHQLHAWYEPNSSRMPISEIRTMEIVRCMMPHDKLLFDQIIINGKIFHPEYCTQRDFFRKLLSRIYEAAMLTEDEGSIDRQAEFLLVFSSVSFRDVEKLISKRDFDIEELKKLVPLERKTFEIFYSFIKKEWNPDKNLESAVCDALIPCIPMLRLATASAWGHADAFIRTRFPELFSSPIGCRALQSMRLEIEINELSKYYVIQERSYGVFPRIDPNNPQSTLLDMKTNLASVSFSWKLSDHPKLNWKGVLAVKNLSISPDVPRSLKTKILNGLIHFANAEVTELERPLTPPSPPKRQGSNPRLLKRMVEGVKNGSPRRSPGHSGRNSVD